MVPESSRPEICTGQRSWKCPPGVEEAAVVPHIPTFEGSFFSLWIDDVATSDELTAYKSRQCLEFSQKKRNYPENERVLGLLSAVLKRVRRGAPPAFIRSTLMKTKTMKTCWIFCVIWHLCYDDLLNFDSRMWSGCEVSETVGAFVLTFGNRWGLFPLVWFHFCSLGSCHVLVRGGSPSTAAFIYAHHPLGICFSVHSSRRLYFNFSPV